MKLKQVLCFRGQARLLCGQKWDFCLGKQGLGAQGRFSRRPPFTQAAHVLRPLRRSVYITPRFVHTSPKMEKADCTLIDSKNVKEFLDSFDTILTDCDGVLWNDIEPIPGSPETVKILKEMGKRVFYVTNNSSKTREEYTQKCAKLGLPAETEDIIGSAYVTARYIKDVLKYDGKVYMIGSSGLKQELDNAGIPNIGFGKDDTDLHGMNLMEMASQPLDPEVGCIVVGYDYSFDYAQLMTATSHLYAKPECHFICTNPDSVLPFGNIGRVLPGTGSIVAAVEVASGRKSIICGKPEKAMFEVAHAKHNIDPARTIMIGDRCNTDIAWGHNCGLRTLLVLTGFSKLEDVSKLKASQDPEDLKQVPHYYVPNLSVIRDLIGQNQ